MRLTNSSRRLTRPCQSKRRLSVVAGLLMSVSALMASAQTLSDALADGAPLALTIGVSGEVAEVLASQGENVQQGEVLVKLDATPFQAELNRATAKLAYAKENHQLQQEDLDRQNELFDEGSLSTVELQILGLKVKQSAADLAAARADYQLAEWRLKQARIVAPVDGEIIATVMVGQRVNAKNTNPVLVKMAVK